MLIELRTLEQQRQLQHEIGLRRQAEQSQQLEIAQRYERTLEPEQKRTRGLSLG
jgi:hypothetical protein